MALEHRYFTRDGLKFHFLYSTGGSPAVVLVHGNSHCGGVWAPLAEDLISRGHEVAAVDLRGHGLSDKPDAGYDWSSLRDDLIALIDCLQSNDVVLVAHSRGGGVSLLATTDPRVRAAVVFEPTLPLAWPADGNAAAPAPPAVVVGRLAQRASRRRTVFASRQALFDHYRTRDAFRDWREDYLRAYIDHGTAQTEDGIELLCPTWVEAKLYEAMAEPGPWAALGRIETPVLVVYGEKSGRLRDGTDPLARLRPSFPNARAEVMAGVTHFGPMESPDAFLALIDGFALKSQS